MLMSPIMWLRIALAAVVGAVADPCECLNWQQTYAAQRVLCGEGLEFGFDYPYGPPKTYEFAHFAPLIMGFTYHEFCGSFFTRMNNNYCVNIKHHTFETVGPEANQWCYVSLECHDLNGGAAIPDQVGVPPVPGALLAIPGVYQVAKALYIWPKIHKRDVAMKICTPGKDKLLSDLGVMKVMELGKSMDSVTGYVTKTAFPMARRNEARSPIWDEIKDAVKKGEVDKLPANIKQAVEQKTPIVVDVDPEGHTHQRILVGKEVYILDNECGPAGCGGAQWPFRKARDMGEL